MISTLELRRFKRFQELTLCFKALTVLTGANGVGKTSIIHALLLVHQATLLKQNEVLRLNDVDSLQLGSARDLIHHQSGSDTMEVTVNVDDTPMSWTFSAPEDEYSRHFNVIKRPETCIGALAEISTQRFVYLSAERLGPRDTLRAGSQESREVGVGVQGEYTAQTLVSAGTFKVREERCLPMPDGGLLRGILHQTEAWMSRIVRPIQLEPEWFPETLVTRLRFRTPGFSSNWMRAPNMGFGVSYALPIVVAALRAPVGSLLLIENPEAHLHPAGQSAMGEFLALMAADGLQILVETQGDCTKF
ncbi:MAG: AAA family ATPase [Myxococcota bacterium]